MKKQGILFLIFTLGLMSVVNAQDYKSFPINKVKNFEQGMYYTIPQTQLVFKIKVEKIVRNKGIYSESAYMLGIDNAIQKQETVYKIKNIDISSKSIPNPNQQYFLTFGEKTIVEKTAIGGLKSIIVTADKDKNQSQPYNLGLMDKRNDNRMPENENLNNKENQNSAPSLSTRPIFETKLMEEGKLKKYPLMPADKVVSEIKRLRDKQIDILSGTVEGTYINTTVDYMYKQLDEIINGYIALFTGVETTTEEEYTFTVVPNKPIIVEEDLLEPICKFSTTKGISDLNAKNDDVKIIAAIHSLNTTSANSKLESSKNSDSQIKEKLEKNGVGVYYSIPEEVNVTVNVGETSTYSKMMKLIQYGTTTYIMNNNSNLSFDENTGSLIRIWK